MMKDARKGPHRGDAELDERIAQFVASGFDPALIADLRHLNAGEKGFTEFFLLADIVAKKMATACDERRHSTDANTTVRSQISFLSTLASGHHCHH